MITRSELQALAQTRLDDAQYLLAAGRTSSAYYLAGYALELALKACIARAFQPDTIPDKAFVLETYTHDLQKLLGTAGLRVQFNADAIVDPQLAKAWSIAVQWNEASRYSVWDAAVAGELINAIADPKSGVFQWLKNHW